MATQLFKSSIGGMYPLSAKDDIYVLAHVTQQPRTYIYVLVVYIRPGGILVATQLFKSSIGGMYPLSAKDGYIRPCTCDSATKDVHIRPQVICFIYGPVVRVKKIFGC